MLPIAKYVHIGVTNLPRIKDGLVSRGRLFAHMGCDKV